MVHSTKKDRKKSHRKQGHNRNAAGAGKIGPSTCYGYTHEHLTPHGGLLAMEKFLDAVRFKELFLTVFVEPSRKTRSGSYFSVKGLVLLLFIGFKRIYPFSYIQEDLMLLGFMGVSRLPHISTFWRFMKSVGINQARALVRMMAVIIGDCHQFYGRNYSGGLKVTALISIHVCLSLIGTQHGTHMALYRKTIIYLETLLSKISF